MQGRAPWGTPGLLAALPPQGCWQGHVDQDRIAAITAYNISIWAWSGKRHSRAGMNVSGMKFFTQRKVPHHEPVLGVVVGRGGLGCVGLLLARLPSLPSPAVAWTCLARVQVSCLAESQRKNLASSSLTLKPLKMCVDCWRYPLLHLLVLVRTCRDIPEEVRLGSAPCCWGLARKKVVLFLSLSRGKFIFVIFVFHPAVYLRRSLYLRRPGVITMQALSEEDRRLWMEAMDGREPVSKNISEKALEKIVESLS